MAARQNRVSLTTAYQSLSGGAIGADWLGLVVSIKTTDNTKETVVLVSVDGGTTDYKALRVPQAPDATNGQSWDFWIGGLNSGDNLQLKLSAAVGAGAVTAYVAQFAS